jgi:glycosyltransferase involved in cell wall biosynthesis
MKVSVLMPIYNAVRYVKAAALSILTQTHKNIELIAIDDGSTDGTTQILEDIASADRRVRLIVRENRGLVASLNQGLELAQGDLIARMDADDIAYPERLSTQVRVFKEHPKLCLLGMGADYLYPGRRVVRSKTIQSSYQDIQIESMFHNMFIHPTVMLSNRIVSANGIRYSEMNPLNEDHELWSRLISDHEAIIVSETGLAWRQQHDSVRTRHYRAQAVSSYQIVQCDLAKNGIDADISILAKMTDQGGMLSKTQCVELRDALEAIWSRRAAFSAQPAFERGFSSLLWNIFESAVAFNDPNQIMNILINLGLTRSISKRHRLVAKVAAYTGPALAAKITLYLRSVNRRIYGSRLERLIALPDEVAQSLR